MRYDPASARLSMARTPAALRALVEGLPEEWLDAREEPGAWSPREVVAHVADLERDAWLPRARWILEHGASRALPGVERERFLERYGGAPLGDVLDDFAAAREANLRALAAMDLDGAALAATGRHASLGEVTLGQLLTTWMVHDLTHLAQITRALASRYREGVGPWASYLSVLRERR